MKKTIKKVLVLCVTLVLAISLLASCSNDSDDSEVKEDAGQSEQTKEQKGESKSSKKEELEQVTLTYFNCWNGSSTTGPEDPTDNPVANKLKEETGVTLDIEYATTSEVEKLNIIFASGDMPDIINAPFWGGFDSPTKILKKAAREGLLLSFDEYIEKYTNVKAALTQGIAKDFRENDLEDRAFEGKHYFIPWQTPRAKEDVTNWAYNAYARKDIIDALGINADDIKTSEDVYNLLKEIKNGGFTDINGNPVIPAGTWANGWTDIPMMNSFNENNLTEFTKVDGKLRYNAFSPLLEEQILFMRKLISEGLFDPEAFCQNDAIAKEKMVLGKVAVFGSHYIHAKDNLSMLYKEHPEMQYIPIGPVLDANGEALQVGQKQLDGRAGCPVLTITKNCEHPEAAIRLIDYIGSIEGQKLVYYGLEGVHYEMVDKKPRMKDEWLDKWNENPQILRNEGIQSIYTWIVSRDCRMSEFGESEPGGSKNADEIYELAKKKSPIKLVSGYRISYFKNEYPEIEKIESVANYQTQRDVIEKAYFAETDEEALKVLEDYRKQLKKSGIEDYEKFINEKTKTRDDIIW